MNNTESKSSPKSGIPLHATNVTQSQTDNNRSSGVEATDNQFCVEKCVDNTMKRDEQPDFKYSNCEMVEQPSCTACLPNEKAEELTETKIELISEHDEERVEKESRCECGVKELQLESLVADDRNLEQFSEVLLDSDSSVSDCEVIVGESVENKKDGKRVHFADEVGTTGTIQGR